MARGRLEVNNDYGRLHERSYWENGPIFFSLSIQVEPLPLFVINEVGKNNGKEKLKRNWKNFFRFMEVCVAQYTFKQSIHIAQNFCMTWRTCSSGFIV